MLKKNPLAQVGVLILLGVFGAWLLGLFGTTNSFVNRSEGDLLSPILGFLTLVISLICLLLVIRRNVKPLDERSPTTREAIRKQGRRTFIWTTTLKRGAIALVAILWPLIFYYSNPRDYGSSLKSLWIVGSLFAAYVLGCYYTAVKTWNAHERDSGDQGTGPV